MPIDLAPHPAPPAVSVQPSAPVELSSLFCSCSMGKPLKVGVSPALVDRANRFWNDGYPSLAEVVVLADAAGVLDDAEIDRFLERLREPIVLAERPQLETEPEDEREVIYARLERLASDRRLRTRYVALMRDLWATFEETWRTHGRAQAEAVAASWTARLAAGIDAVDLMHDHHIVRRQEEFSAMVRRAQREGTLRIAPSVSGHGHIVALPGSLSLSSEAVAPDLTVTRRQIASEIADRLKALSDPTRLTILAQLAEAPIGVSELARVLHIAQPTASVHLRQLREAGLVTAERDGNRTRYSARPDAVEHLLTDVSERLTRSMAAST